MEKTGKHIGCTVAGGRLLLISCLCTETCSIKTPQPAVSLIFTDTAKDTSAGKRGHLLFFHFHCFSLGSDLGRAQQAAASSRVIYFFFLFENLEMFIWRYWEFKPVSLISGDIGQTPDIVGKHFAIQQKCYINKMYYHCIINMRRLNLLFLHGHPWLWVIKFRLNFLILLNWLKCKMLSANSSRCSLILMWSRIN